MAGIRSRKLGGGKWTDHPETDLSKPLTLICHQGNVELEMDDVIEIDYDVTRYHGNRVVRLDPIAKVWIEYILGFQIERDMLPKDRPNLIAHVIGLVELPIKLMQKAGHGLPIFIREPETSLHPSQHIRVAHFLTTMSQDLDPDTGEFTTLPPDHKEGLVS